MLSLFGCIKPQTYENNQPKFDIRQYLNGDLEAFGILQDWRGKIIKSFTVTMKGSWQGNNGLLDEKFVFSDGQVQSRTWQITMLDDHNFTATAGDVVKPAKGSQYGNAVKMDYVLAIPVNNKIYNFAIKDWLFMVDEKSLINISTINKFGITVAKISIGFKKLS
jgi:hypothetical protein